ncbi:ABC transporter ATP-binding protein [Paracoccus aminophilus]|uniref:Spermidine/putrescine import ATP-binding protein PotA n=1 Tax=Paracoccus aminophilus JCM 7686 TaxID=1367847 RepID=S5YX35_PARAH|nr:ABC transporter ATP-binding protein [Paracoccus aminophilus]AGT09781.1 spermidine/putrescine transport system, ATP-binding protein [Paracoccus aminophilus JCM 7686]
MTVPSATALPVTITALSKHYGAVRAVDDVSFDVAPGEFLTLLGPSGSGKTTLLMMIAGFSRPSAGSIRIAGQEIVHLPPHKRNIGMVFQNYALFPHMSVGENIAYPLKLRGVGRAEREDCARRALDLVQLAGLESRRISQLSGGQRQRIALARAIVFEPRILLMDEPLSALDKQLRESMQIEIRRIHDRLGMTTISVTHDQREALTMSDRIAVFAKGKLAQIAAPSDLYEKPQSRFVAEFIGESSFLPVKRTAEGWSHAGQPLHLPADTSAEGDAALLMLRPEQLRLRPVDSATPEPDLNRFRGRIEEVVYQGESLLLDVALDGGRVLLRLPNRAGEARSCPPRGASVDLLLHRDDTRLVAQAGAEA